MFASLGAAAENLAIAAAARGTPGEAAFDPAADGTIRADFDGGIVSAADLGLLARASAIPGVDLILVTDRNRMGQLRDLILAGNSAQIADRALVAELRSWLRFNPASAARTGDGLFVAANGNPSLPDWIGPRMFDWSFSAEAENRKSASQIASSAGMAILKAARADTEHWVQAGRACQRFALQATALGLKHAFLNQPVEVPALRSALADLVGLPGRRPDLVMRFGRGAAMPYSARRPVGAVMA